MNRHPLFAQCIGLIGWLAIAFSAAAVGAIASVGAPQFYASLIRPDWAPPGWLFGPVWTALFTLMGIAAWLVWRERPGSRSALALFLVQLAVNALWSWLFFVWHLGAAAFAEMIVLLGLIAATMASFWRIRRIAATLLVPYLLWVGFATLLTWSLWQSNPARL